MVTTYRTIKIKLMYSLIILLSRGRMSDYADSPSTGMVVVIILILATGFIVTAIIARWREKNK